MRIFRIVPEKSEARYEVEEEFFNRPLRFFRAVGRTRSIEGELQWRFGNNGLELVPSRFAVDLRTLRSDSGNRDRAIRGRWLESDKYPTAEFIANRVQGFPPQFTEGEPINFKLAGDMTIRQITKPLTFDVQAVLNSTTLTGTATALLFMKDFGFDPPALFDLKVTDGVTVTIDFTAQEVGSAAGAGQTNCTLTMGERLPGPLADRADLSSRLQLAPADEKGERLIISGAVYNQNCIPLLGAVIEVWQANADGQYVLPRLSGRLKTDAQGRYEFETIKPGFYGGPAHIHYKVSHPRAQGIETELLFAGDPYLTAGAPDSLIAPISQEGSTLHGAFNIVLRESTD